MFQIAHEAPISIMKEIRGVTDYCYCLVHLFPEYQEYFEYFVESKAIGRKVLLDNSIYELSEAYDSKEYIKWINKLNPSEYIIPDMFNSYEGTKRNLLEFKELGGIESDAKTIGVVHGRTYNDIKECYKFMVDHVDKIAFSFAYDYFLDGHGKNDAPWLPFALGRKELLDDLIYENIIDYSKPHHILGSSLPFEFRFYTEEKYSFIESIDTSNPVVAGILGYKYHPKHGSTEKWSCKLVDYIDTTLSEFQLENIKNNVNIFRNMCVSYSRKVLK
jgi:hypothetical protein